MINLSKAKSVSSNTGPLGGADLRFFSPLTDTSLHCGCMTTDIGITNRAVCPFAA